MVWLARSECSSHSETASSHNELEHLCDETHVGDVCCIHYVFICVAVIQACIHPNMYAIIHDYIHASLQSYMLAFIQVCVRSYMFAFIQSCVHSYMPCVHPSLHSSKCVCNHTCLHSSNYVCHHDLSAPIIVCICTHRCCFVVCMLVKSVANKQHNYTCTVIIHV